MKIFQMIGVIALSLAPSLTFAMCSDEAHAQTTMSCAEGKVFDAETKACVPISS